MVYVIYEHYRTKKSDIERARCYGLSGTEGFLAVNNTDYKKSPSLRKGFLVWRSFGTFINEQGVIEMKKERIRDVRRPFWTLESEENENDLGEDKGKPARVLELGDEGKKCAYGDPRDKPPRVRGRGFCPYSRERKEVWK